MDDIRLGRSALGSLTTKRNTTNQHDTLKPILPNKTNQNVSFRFRFAQYREYTCQTQLQRDQWVWVLKRALRNEWQAMLEREIIAAPEYYQVSACVK